MVCLLPNAAKIVSQPRGAHVALAPRQKLIERQDAILQPACLPKLEIGTGVKPCAHGLKAHREHRGPAALDFDHRPVDRHRAAASRHTGQRHIGIVESPISALEPGT